ncbi:VENN motif pre-toxin domain-containing protein, partial [Gilliamella sp. Bim1-2]
MVAELQGNSALVGGLGAAASERGAEVIAGILYPDKDIKDLSQEERQQISALSQLATGLAIAAMGGDIQDINTGVAAGKNAVENNGLSWADGGFGGDFIGLSPETGANYEGILHASAAGYLTQEETEEALERLITGKDMPNGSDYVELWMRAPEQIGAFLPGPISAAMAALAMADKSLTDTDKADLISVLNKATGDYLSGADTESLLELNTALSRFGAKSTNKQFQQFIKEKVENNVATSQKGNKSSKFGEHVK